MPFPCLRMCILIFGLINGISTDADGPVSCRVSESVVCLWMYVSESVVCLWMNAVSKQRTPNIFRYNTGENSSNDQKRMDHYYLGIGHVV